MGNEESRIRSNNKKYKSRHHEDISDSYASEEDRQHYRMSSRSRCKTSSKLNYEVSRSWSRSPGRGKRAMSQSSKRHEVSRSWSRSPGRGKRAMSQSSKRPEGRLKIEEIKPICPDYYCKDCDCYSSGKVSWNQHIVGRRHAKNTGREIPDSYVSKKRKLVRTESYKRLHDYVPKEKLMKFNERKTDNRCSKKLELSNNVSKHLIETDQEDDNYVGLDYILVIHKHGKSVFQCFLCDTSTIYQNSQQLKDHILGVNHQRAYGDEKNKSSIRIKRLKSRNPGKSSLEELIQQKLFSPNRAERNSKKSTETNRDNSQPCNDSKSSKMNNLPASTSRKAKSFLQKTIEQVQLHNRKYELKMKSTTFRPERNLSTPASESVFSKNSTPSRCTTASPGCGSTSSFPSFNDISSLDTCVSTPEFSKSAQTLCLLELVETLSTIDIFKLLLLKLKNVEIQEQELPFLEEVADATTALSKKFNKQYSTLQKENLDMQEASIPLFIDVSNHHCNSEKDVTEVENATLHVEIIDDQPNSQPFLVEAINLCTSGNKNSPGLEISPKVFKRSSNASAIMDQLDQPIQPPAAFWNSLPSTQDLENILSNLPSLNTSKNSNNVVEIQID